MLVLMGIAFKWWLISRMEITDDLNDPFHYVSQILSNSGLCYGPGTGLVGKLFYHLGIPFRTGIEIAYLVGSFLTIKALIGSPMKIPAASLLYLFVILNPNTAELFSHFMSDQIWLVEILLGLSCLVFSSRMRSKYDRIYAVLAGLCLGLSVITRSTFIPLMVTFSLWAVLCLPFILFRSTKTGLNFRFIAGGFLCFYTIVFIYYAICFHNSNANGYFGLSVFDSREYRSFYMTLQSVGDADGEPYYPVDNARQKLIAEAGPRSKYFVDRLALDRQFREVSQKVYGRYDLALPWFHWAIFETVYENGDLDKTFSLFRDVEREISNAKRNKILKIRPIIPLPDCRMRIVLSVLPPALCRTTNAMIYEPPRYAWAWADPEPKFVDKEFSQALNRRNISPDPTRNETGKLLCIFYAPIYAPLPAVLLIVLAGFISLLIYHWKNLGDLTFYFLVQQLYLVLFGVFFLWYLLFDASGLIVTNRYMVFHNVMLPILIVYYADKVLFLFRNHGLRS